MRPIQQAAIALSSSACLTLLVAETNARQLVKPGAAVRAVAPIAPDLQRQDEVLLPDPEEETFTGLFDVDPAAPLRARNPVPKWMAAGQGSWVARIGSAAHLTGRIHVKFRDDLKVRSGMTPSAQLTREGTRSGLVKGPGLGGPDLGGPDPIDEARALMAVYAASAEQAVKIPLDRLKRLQAKAERIGRVRQPDLGGLIAMNVGAANAIAAAEAFNALDCVEFATAELWPRPAQEQCQPVDQSLQKGPGARGDNVVGCQQTTNDLGAPIVCQPGPILAGFNGIPQIAGTIQGFNNCNRPATFAFYAPINEPWPDANRTCTPLYLADVFANPLWDCTPNCNAPALCNQASSLIYTQGGNPACQYGCSSILCAEQVAEFQPNCNDPDNLQGWDAICATIANLVCPPNIPGTATPYNGVGASGSVALDQNTSACYQGAWYVDPDPAAQWPQFAATNPYLDYNANFAYDPCFVRRGPANFGLSNPGVFSIGSVIYTDVGATGNGLVPGVRPWGYIYESPPNAMPAYAYAENFATGPETFPTFTQPAWIAAAFGVPAPVPFTTNAFCGAITSGDQTVAGLLRNLSTTTPDTIVDPITQNILFRPSRDPAFKSGPNYFSKPCTEPSDFPGCNVPECCAWVCIQDPACCDVNWDDGCVSLANTAPTALCRPGALASWDPNAPSPLFRAEVSGAFARNLQLYTTSRFCAPSTQTLIQDLPNPNAAQPPGSRAAVVAGGSGQFVSLTEIEATPTGQTQLDQSLAFVNSQYGGGGLDLAGFEQLATSLDNVLVEDARGFGVRIGVIDYSAYINHEDLVGRVRLEEGIDETMILLVNAPPVDPDHGTAVLGIVAANAANGIGIDGIAPESEAVFFPAIINVGGSLGGNSPRLTTAIISAGEQLDVGDVLLVAMDYPQGGTMVSDPTLNLLLGVATGLGVNCVVPAGNGGFESITNEGGNNAILVGGVWPGPQVPTPVSGQKAWDANGIEVENSLANPGAPFPGSRYCRYPTSNWSEGTPGFAGAIDVSGWGSGMCTLGAGTLFRGNNPAVTNPAEIDQLRTYQASFTGTSGAAAMIAGLTARLQGTAKAFLGAALSQDRLRNLYANIDFFTSQGPIAAGTVTLQCGFAPQVGLPGTLSNAAQVVAFGDLIYPGATNIHVVGGFPQAREMLVKAILTRPPTQGYPFSLRVITGQLINGGIFDAINVDGAFVRVQAVRAGRGATGSGYGRPLLYAGAGGITDIQLRVNLPITQASDLFELAVRATGRVSTSLYLPPGFDDQGSSYTPSASETGFALLYAYDQTYGRWRYLAFGSIDPLNRVVASEGVTRFGYIASNFAVPEDGGFVSYARVLTFSGGIAGQYQVWWDQLLVDSQPLTNP